VINNEIKKTCTLKGKQLRKREEKNEDQKDKDIESKKYTDFCEDCSSCSKI